MNLPDSFYIALCMTILLVGAVYWVWTQIQYVQRKVNILENIVYELKTLCAKPEEGPVIPTSYPAPAEDLHEELRAEVAPYATVEEIPELAPMPEEKPVVTEEPLSEVQNVPDMPDVPDVPDAPEAKETVQEPIFNMSHFVREVESEDLQPGGVGSGIVAPSLQSSLDGMTIKELRRLAQQKGISGANDMKKKELIEAIRAVPVESFLE
jgi:hypothetical protein